MWEGETFDRHDLLLPCDQPALVQVLHVALRASQALLIQMNCALLGEVCARALCACPSMLHRQCSSWHVCMQAVARHCPNTTIVVVLIHGGPLDVGWMMASSRVGSRVGAVLTAWFPGQASRAKYDCPKIADIVIAVA